MDDSTEKGEKERHLLTKTNHAAAGIDCTHTKVSADRMVRVKDQGGEAK